MVAINTVPAFMPPTVRTAQPSLDDPYTARLIDALLKGATSTAPIQSHWQGANQLAQSAIAGALMARDRAEREKSGKLLLGLPGLGGSQPGVASTSPATSPVWSGPSGTIQDSGPSTPGPTFTPGAMDPTAGGGSAPAPISAPAPQAAISDAPGAIPADTSAPSAGIPAFTPAMLAEILTMGPSGSATSGEPGGEQFAGIDPVAITNSAPMGRAGLPPIASSAGIVPRLDAPVTTAGEPQAIPLPQRRPAPMPTQQPTGAAVPLPARDALPGPTPVPLPTRQQGAMPFYSPPRPPMPTMPATDYAGQVPDMIRAASSHYGLEPQVMLRMAELESQLDPRAKNPNSSASGVFQFTGGTWGQYGRGNPFDAAQNIDAGARLAVANSAHLKRALGRDPLPHEIYLAHQQGAAGATALLSDPNVKAIDALTPAYSGNRRMATQAILQNGGRADMTAGQFASLWQNKFYGGGTQTAALSPAGARNDAPVMSRGIPADAMTQPAAMAGAFNQVPGGQAPGRDRLQLAQVYMPPSAPAPMQQAPAGGAPQAGGATPNIPPAYQAWIQQAFSSRDPQMRALGLQIYSQFANPETKTVDLGDKIAFVDGQGRIRSVLPKFEKPEFGVIGKDQYGNEQYGWKNPRTMTVTPSEIPGATRGNPAQSEIPPPPPGYDPKKWREEFTKRGAENAAPPTRAEVMQLRKEIQDLPSYKNVSQAAPIYKTMISAAGRDTRAADVNLIYGLAKIMDPNSVVRESEMSVAQAVATFPQWLQAQVTSQMQATGRLDADVREAIMQEAHSRMVAYKDMIDTDLTQFKGIASRSRMNLEDVIPSFGPFEPYKRGATAFDNAPGRIPAGPAAADPMFNVPGAGARPSAAGAGNAPIRQRVRDKASGREIELQLDPRTNQWVPAR